MATTEINQPKPEHPTSQQAPGNIPAGPPPDQLLEGLFALRSELKFDSRLEDGKTFFVIEDPVRSKFFQVGPREYTFIASFDGKRSPKEIMEALNAKMDVSEVPYDEDTIRTISQWLMQSNLVVGDAVDNSKRLSQQANSMKKAKLVGLLNPISFKFRLFNPNASLKAIQSYFQWMFSVWFAAIWCAVAVFALSEIYSHWDQMGAASAGILSGSSWIWLMLTWIILKVIHESAHGIACRRYGGEVPEAGVLLLLFTPMAYVNVTSMWRFPNRWHRMVVAGAGMYVELFISFIAVIVWTKTTGVVADIAFNVFLMASVTTILFNANPLMRFDGYFLLSDGLAVPNLYTKGTKWFGDRVKSLFFGIPKTPNLYADHEFRKISIYGCLAFFWKISISVSLIIGAGVLFHGAGITLSAFGVAMWFGMPIFRQFKSVFGPNAQHKVRPLRIGISCVVVALTCLSFFYVLKAPASKSAPAIVQFADETILRAGANGFISELLVEDGAKVTKGQTLVVLTNPTLSNEVKELERLVSESLIQSRIFKKQTEMALAVAELEKMEELKAQLNEKAQQAEGLTLHAPFDGFAFRRNVENEIGNFAKRGDPIITVAQRQTKEVVVSIDQRDLESIKVNTGEFLKVAFPGVAVFKSKMTHVNPKVSQEPSHPSLCAQAGGPLTVRPVSTSGDSEGVSKFELLSPRFNVVLELDEDASRSLRSGQRGRAFFSACQQSLGSYLYIATSDWLKAKIEIATQTALF